MALGGDGAGIGQVKVDQLSISGDLIVLGLGLVHGPTGIRGIEVCNWKTGQVTKVRPTLPPPLESRLFIMREPAARLRISSGSFHTTRWRILRGFRSPRSPTVYPSL